jgi:hypothetical protein
MRTIEKLNKDKKEAQDKINEILMEFLDKYEDLEIDISVHFTKYGTMDASKSLTHSVSTRIEIHI